MRKARNVKQLLVVLLALLLGFCWGTGVAQGQITDPEINLAVENQLLLDPAVEYNDVDVTVERGIVTLAGNVSNILSRDRAAKVARIVKGVRAVVNRIKVAPAQPRPDQEIAADVQQAFFNDPLAESWELDSAVENGVVTLVGTVESWAERELIGQIAKGIKGVVGLNNNLMIDSKSVRSDEEIRQEIDRRLYWDALVDDRMIDISVNGGRVLLTGAVGSAAERVRAHGDAWVSGVKSVDSGGIEVKWWARNENLRQGKYVLRDDEEIRQAVQDAFLYDPRLSKLEIRIMVDNGRVTLSGVVDNLRAKRVAAQDARNTVGVWQVRNLLKVRPGTPTDDMIAGSIRDAFLMDPYIERRDIDVMVLDGLVYLSGSVDSYYEKAQADYIASGIYGVKDVHNRLVVQDEQDILTYSPHVDPWYTYDYNWYIYPDYTPVTSDDEITREIKEEFFWSPFIDGETIDVTVTAGVARLTGSVDSWSEYSAAVENALEGGAVAVQNELQIKTRQQ